MEASELPYQVNDINVFLEYNRGEQDLQAIEILQNIETISVCASIMGGVIMGLSAMLSLFFVLKTIRFYILQCPHIQIYLYKFRI